MKELIVKIEGRISQSNFEEYKAETLAQIAAVNTDLKTDEDFADAEAKAKRFKEKEAELGKVKADVLEQAKEIQVLFAGIDELADAMKDKRLELGNLVKTEKSKRKQALINDAHTEVSEFISRQSKDFMSALTPGQSEIDRRDIEGSLKGMSSFDKMQEAATKAAQETIDGYKVFADMISKNAKEIDEASKEHPALFMDRAVLLSLPSDVLTEKIQSRIAVHKADEARKAAEAKVVEKKPEAPKVEPAPKQDEKAETFEICFTVRGGQPSVVAAAKNIRVMLEGAGVEVIGKGGLRKVQND